jgi:hypothetical protein
LLPGFFCDECVAEKQKPRAGTLGSVFQSVTCAAYGRFSIGSTFLPMGPT